VAALSGTGRLIIQSIGSNVEKIYPQNKSESVGYIPVFINPFTLFSIGATITKAVLNSLEILSLEMM
jgi:hypothetical protein